MGKRREEENTSDMLSYRVSMPVAELKVYRCGAAYYVCPRCNITMDREFNAFCDNCGQKLSWRGYKKAKLYYV